MISRDPEVDEAIQWAKKRAPLLILGVIVIFVLLDAWFIVGKEENAVVQRFGRHVRTVEPGLQFKVPWPVETQTKVPVMRIQRLEIGFRTTGRHSDKPVESENVILTGDMNIVILDWVVQYRVSNAAKWLFRVRDPETVLNFLGQGVMRLVVGGNDFDAVATTGRGKVQEETEKLLQALCDMLDFGVTIVAVQLQDVHPPQEVSDAFKDVTNAKEDKEQKINVARGYQNEKIPHARGEAQEIIEASMGYREERIARAEGDAKRFLALYEEYQKAPEVTRQRLRFEALQLVLHGKAQLIDRSEGLLKFFDTTKSAREGR